MKVTSHEARRKNAGLRVRSITFQWCGLFLSVLALLGLAVPLANADHTKKAAATSGALSKSFKGRLPITELSEDEAIMHALNRLAYGPRLGDIERIRKMGLEKWILQQLDPGAINDSAMESRLTDYPTLKMSSAQLVDTYAPPQVTAKKQSVTKEEVQRQRKDRGQVEIERLQQEGVTDPARLQLAKLQGPQRVTTELAMAKLERAIYSERQLQEVLVDFWFNHFNIFADKGADRWMITAYDRDVIRPHAMGKFEDMLVATAKSPAMLFYLDNWLSADPAASKKLDGELAARRKRFTGTFGGAAPPPAGTFPAPQPKGTAPSVAPKKEARGLNENYGREVMELHTLGVEGGYTQQDVIAMAECLTGWTIRTPQKDPEFFFDNRIHATGVKTVLGHKFDYGGMKDGEEAIKMLAQHPSTAQFISLELARHFVSDTPPPTLVTRMAQSFTSSSGNIRTVLHTMIYSPEFWSRAAFRAKVKTPFELGVSVARALDANVTVALPMNQWVSRMGEPLFLAQPPTGYPDKAEMWVNTGALLNRLNFALTMATNHLNGTVVDLSALFGVDSASDAHLTLSRALDIFLDGQVAPGTRATLENRLADPQVLQARLDDPVKHVNQGLIAGLVLGAPEFQRR